MRLFFLVFLSTHLFGFTSDSFCSNIKKHEEEGDYASALTIARQLQEELLKGSSNEKTALISQSIQHLETLLLRFGYSRRFFDQQGRPNKSLLQLLTLVGYEPFNKEELPLFQINRWAQKNLLRKGERWHEQTARFEPLSSKLKPLLAELGFTESISPHFHEYEGALVLGALLPRVRLRIHSLVAYWNQGVRFRHIYFLSGARPLDVHQENKTALLYDVRSPLKIRKDWTPPNELPQTECEMMQWVWEQSDLPSELRNSVQIHFINAPMSIDSQTNILLRPTTDDTIKYWLQDSPLPGRYLAITNAPYMHRQDLLLRTLAPSNYGFDTVGASITEQDPIAALLDELARCIFQYAEKFKKSS